MTYGPSFGVAVGALAAKATEQSEAVPVPTLSYDERIRLEKLETQAREDRIERLNREAQEKAEREAEAEFQRYSALTPEEQEAEFRQEHHNQQVRSQRSQAYRLANKALEKDVNAHLDLSYLSGPFEWSGGRVLIPVEELAVIVEEVRTKIQGQIDRKAIDQEKQELIDFAEAEAAAHSWKTLWKKWINRRKEEAYQRGCLQRMTARLTAALND
jgi:hypothetical protein